MSSLEFGDVVPIPKLPSTISPFVGAKLVPAYDDPIALLPLTSNLLLGVLVPIPTWPDGSILIYSDSFIENNIFWFCFEFNVVWPDASWPKANELFSVLTSICPNVAKSVKPSVWPM